MGEHESLQHTNGASIENSLQHSNNLKYVVRKKMMEDWNHFFGSYIAQSIIAKQKRYHHIQTLINANGVNNTSSLPSPHSPCNCI